MLKRFGNYKRTLCLMLISFMLFALVNSFSEVNATVVPGDIVKEYVLDKTYNGSSDYDDKTSDVSAVSGLSQGSILVRFKTTSTTNSKSFISASHTADPSSNITFTVEPSGVVYFENRENDVYATKFSSNGTYNDGYWHVAVLTVNSSGTKLYVDGVLNLTDPSTAFFSNVTSLNGMWIGKNVDSDHGSEWYYSGDLERVTIYNRVLTAAEVAEVTGPTAASAMVKSYEVNRSYNGTSDYTDETADVSLVSGLAQGSILARFKTSSVSGSRTLFSASHTADPSSNMTITVEPDGNIYYENREDEIYASLITEAGPFNDNAWHTAVLTVDGKGTCVYVDGVLKARHAGVAFFSNITSMNGMWIGKNVDSTGSQWYYAGDIDKVNIYNRGLTAMEVAQLSGIAPPAAPGTGAGIFKESTVWSTAESWTGSGICAIPNGKSVPRLLLLSCKDSDNDDYVEMACSTSDDLGNTWSDRSTVYGRQTCPDGNQGMLCDPIPVYHPQSGKVIIFGVVASYVGNTEVHDYPGYAYYDPSTGTFSSQWYIFNWPTIYGHSGCSVPYIETNGDIYWAIKNPDGSNDSTSVVRCTFNGTTLSYVSQSGVIPGTGTSGNRSGLECSITKFNNVYYLVERDDIQNKVSTSTNLTTWTTCTNMLWDDGSSIAGTNNTQVRWLNHGDNLYIVYTRQSVNPSNSSVPRYRAPIWMARFDTSTERLVKSTEQIAINMNYINSMASAFTTCNATPDYSFVATSEYNPGSTTRTVVSRVKWNTPNTLATPGGISYILNEPWNSTTGWTKSANPVISPAGQLRVYSTNGSTQNIYRDDMSIPGVYSLKWSYKIDSYNTTNETCVLKVNDGSNRLELRVESDGIYTYESGAWVKKKFVLNDFNWHEILVNVVNGQAEVLLDGVSQFTYPMYNDTSADKIELYSTNGDFHMDYLQIW